MSGLVSSSATQPPYIRTGFRWDASDAYLFDIDGTLLNCRDAVHYWAFHQAVQDVLGITAGIDGVPLHGNTDIGILRAALRRAGVDDAQVDLHLPRIVEQMCAEAQRNCDQFSPELCPSIRELALDLLGRGKLLGIASGNLEPIGWMKLEKADLKSMFSFGSFAWPPESRTEIFLHGATMARQRLDPSAGVCVLGDTPADIHAARAAGLPVIVLATGIYSFPDLLAYEPDACFTSAFDLLALAL
ncbi:MAG TPA: HAD hydrolase-like protein [Candidatus Angelobacter sp.]|nr:HAD hydrolase-like protein [Candidatus Angelobacter sp.]